MRNYYFLATALPPLNMGTPPELGFEELEYLFKENLHPADLALTKHFRLSIDIENLRRFFSKKPLDPHGNLNENALEEALLTQTGLPPYVYHYLEEWETNKERLSHFPQRLAAFYQSNHPPGFLTDYFHFEREWRLVLLGFRAKLAGRDLLHELQYEDPHDPLIAQLLAQKDAKTFEPPQRYEALKVLFQRHQEEPLALFQALDTYRLEKVKQMIGLDVFTIDRILSYMVRLTIIEQELELDQKKGRDIALTLIKEAS